MLLLAFILFISGSEIIAQNVVTGPQGITITEYKQFTGGWEDEPIGNCNFNSGHNRPCTTSGIGEICKIHDIGCLMVCAAIILEANGTNADPYLLNKWLTDSNYYNAGCNFRGDEITNHTYQNSTITWVGNPYIGPKTQCYSKIKTQLDLKNPVIVQVNSFCDGLPRPKGHWVAVYGYESAGTEASDFLVSDPARNNTGCTLLDCPIRCIGTDIYGPIIRYNNVTPSNLCNDDPEPNNSYQTATTLFQPPLSTTAKSVTKNAFISTGSDQDWYSVNFSGAGVLTINLNSLPMDYDIELYGSNGNNGPAIAYSYNSGTAAEDILINHTLISSTPWYIKVYPKDPSQFSACDDYALSVSWEPNNTQFDIPPGCYKSIFLAGLNLYNQTNELEFLLQGIPAQLGDIPVNIPDEVANIQKRFKQALAIPEGNQWISLNIIYGGDATAGDNFQNTDLAKDFFEADVNLKFSSVFKPVTGFTAYSGIFTDWNNLILQGPYLSQLQALPNLYYPFWGIYAGIHSKNLNYSSQGATKIIINDASMEMHKGILWAELDNSVNSLASNLRTTLLSKIPAYQTQLLQRLTTGVNITTPLVNSTGAQFQQLRNSYRITAAAHWYKTLTVYSNKPYNNLINSNNLSGIMVSPPYNDSYWDGQALQPLPNLYETYNYYNNQGSGSYSCYGGVSFGNYNLIDTGTFNNNQIGIDTICFKNHGYITIDSIIYFYGGTLDYPIADLTGIIQPQNINYILGDTVQVSATIFNYGNTNAQQFPVRLYEQYTNGQGQLQNIFVGQQIINNLDSFSIQTLPFTWIPLTYGSKKIILTIDEGNQVVERKETNNTATDSLYIHNKVPIVEIIYPDNGSAVVSENITLNGSAYDLRDGYLDYNDLSWTSSIDGLLGNGSYLTMDSLSVGNHTITLTGTNSHGQTAFDYISLHVFPQGYPLVSINSPLNGDTLPDNVNVFFSGNAYDLDDGSLCGNATWSSNLDGTLGTGCTISHLLSQGNHIIIFSAQNTSGKTGTATIQYNVVNGFPNISIISPVINSSFYQHQSVSLQATATDFPQGNISNIVQWFSNLQGYLGTGQSISVILQPGNHIITASVQDNTGSVDTAVVNPIIIKYTPPVPAILQPINNQTYTYQDTITFIGNASDLQDGALHGTNLKWYSNVNGFLGFCDTLQSNSLTYGYHNISLKATDSNGADSTVSVTNIFIDAGLPVVSITQPLNGAGFFFGNGITFTGSSTDPQDGVLSGSHLQWYSNHDGLIGTGNSITFDSLSPGNHTITLNATDYDGFTGFATINLFIEPPHPPSVSIFYPFSNNHYLHGYTVTLKATANDYEEGNLPNHRVTWNSNLDGNLGAGKIISINSLSVGAHLITATASDTTNLTSTVSINVIIDQRPPVAQINYPTDGSVFAQGTNIAFAGTGNDYEDGILPGTSLQWKSNVNGVLGTGQILNTNSLSYGSHLITLIATDSQGAKDSASITIIVQAPNTILLTKFNNGADSISHLFASIGGDTIIYVSIPKTATVLNAQATITGRSDLFASVSITANPPGTVTCGTTLTFTASYTNGGSNPSFQWQVNGVNVGTNSPLFSSNSLQNGDYVNVIMTSNMPDINENTVMSNIIIINCTP